MHPASIRGSTRLGPYDARVVLALGLLDRRVERYAGIRVLLLALPATALVALAILAGQGAGGGQRSAEHAYE